MIEIADLLSLHPEIAQFITGNAAGIKETTLSSTRSDGAFSTGQPLHIETTDGQVFHFFISRPNGRGFGLTNNTASQLSTLLESHRAVPHTMEPLALLAVLDDGQIVDISRTQYILKVAELLPESSIPLTSDLVESFKGKWTDEQILEHFMPIGEAVANVLVQIHSQSIPDDIVEKAQDLYSESLWRVHSDKELLAGIMHKIDFSQNTWLRLAEASFLRTLMERFEHATRNQPERLTALHGDPWWRNTYRTADNEILFIDQSRSSYGEPAIDVALAIGDSINNSLVRNKSYSGPFLEVANHTLQTYIDQSGDYEVLKMLPITLAYKSFAAAVNNPGIPDAIRRRLFATGVGCLAQANQQLEQGNPMEFRLECLSEYETFGVQLLGH